MSWKRISKRWITSRFPAFCDTDAFVAYSDDEGIRIIDPLGPQQFMVPLKRNLREIAAQLIAIADRLDTDDMLLDLEYEVP